MPDKQSDTNGGKVPLCSVLISVTQILEVLPCTIPNML